MKIPSGLWAYLLDFVHKLKNYRINNNEKRLSFDIVALCPSIPVNETISIV